jgi:hypothetical protein
LLLLELPLPELLLFFLLKLVAYIPIPTSDLDALDLAALLDSSWFIFLGIPIPPAIGLPIAYTLAPSPCFGGGRMSTIKTVGNPSSLATAAACIIFFHATMNLPFSAA